MRIAIKERVPLGGHVHKMINTDMLQIIMYQHKTEYKKVDSLAFPNTRDTGSPQKGQAMIGLTLHIGP
jgi:hypothetical protein